MSSSKGYRRVLTGVFATLGFLFFLPLLWTGYSLFQVLAFIANVTFGSLRWDSIQSFWQSLIEGNGRTDSSLNFVPVLLGFIVVYAVLLWQWVACLFRWWMFLRPRRLWAVTAIYFMAFMAYLQFFTYTHLNQGDSPPNWFAWWLVVDCAIPFTFIVLSMRLWQSTPLSSDEFETDRG